MSRGMTESELIQALYTRFAPPTYALLEQVRNGTGWQRQTRTADALALCLWPSRGLELHGIEIKVSRADWLAELKNPAKAEEIARFTDRWWVAISDPSIVRDGELPKTWGLLVPKGQKLVAKVEAPELDPQPITRTFLAAIFRRAMAVVTPAARMEALRVAAHEEGRRLGQEQAKALAQRDTDWARRDLQQLQQRVTRFEESSGVSISSWGAGNISKAVGIITAGRLFDAGIDAKAIPERLRQLAATVEASLLELAQLTEPAGPGGGP